MGNNFSCCSSVLIMRANVFASVLLLVPQFIFAKEHSDACLHSPHHLRIKYFDNDYCDAGLYVNEGGVQVAVTSASCLNNIQNEIFSKHLSVFAGKPELDLQKPHLDEQFRIVTDFVLHPDWNNKNNDIAIVFVKSNFEITSCVKPLKAFPTTVNSDLMQSKVSVSFWSHRKIRQNTIHVNKTCIDPPSKMHLCTETCVPVKYGGGPAVSTVGESSFLVGIWSQHENDSYGKCLRSVFTNASLFTKWIESQVAHYLNPSESSTTSSSLGRGKRVKRSPRRRNRELFFPGTKYARSNYQRSYKYERPIIEPRVGGRHTRPANATSAPWFVQIRYNGDFVSSGGLVTGYLGHHIVLTSAKELVKENLVDHLEEDMLEIKAGMLDKERDCCFTQSRFVRKLILTPKAPKENNFAIIWLDKQFHVNEFVKPLPLPPRYAFYPHKSAPIEVAGYGKGFGKFGNRLEIKVTETLDRDKCEKSYVEIYGEDTVKYYEMCTWEWTNDGQGGPCRGDEGTVGRTIDQETHIVYAAAIFSWTWGDCGFVDHPAVYVRVSSFLKWIRAIDEKITEDYGPFPTESEEEYLP